MKLRVLFVCTHNSARSLIAESYLAAMAGDICEVHSAGLNPGTINPYVVQVMREEGLDLTHVLPRSIYAVYQQIPSFDYVVTVCDPKLESQCPFDPGIPERYSWPFPDPRDFAGSYPEILAQTREVRDSIKARVVNLVEHLRGLR